MARAAGIVNPDPLELYNLGSVGIIADREPHLLVPEAYSSGRNIRFDSQGFSRSLDPADAFGALSASPEFIFNVPAPGVNFWLYATLTKMYAFDGTSSAEITRASGGNYTVSAGFGRLWQGTILGGVPIFNNSIDVPQYWTGLTLSDKLADLSAWPSGLRAKIIRAFGPYLVAFNLTDGADVLQKTMQWSAFADPGTVPASWDYTDPTIDAGRSQLTDDKGGEIVDAVLLGDNMVIYCNDSTHILKYVGGVAIFSPQLILKDSGLLTAHCACNFNKGTAQLAVTQDDIIIHSGSSSAQSIVENKIRNKVFSEIDAVAFATSFVVENSRMKEVWFCYPSSGASKPDTAMIWNYRDNTCTFKDVAGLVSADTGNIYNVDTTTWAADTDNWDTDDIPWNPAAKAGVIVVSNNAAAALQLDRAYNSGVTAFVERSALSLDSKDRSGQPKAGTKSVKQINRMWIKATGDATLQVKLGIQDTIDGPITWSAPQSFNIDTDKYLDWDVVGKLLGYHIESTDATAWSVQGVDFEWVEISQL